MMKRDMKVLVCACNTNKYFNVVGSAYDLDAR